MVKASHVRPHALPLLLGHSIRIVYVVDDSREYNGKLHQRVGLNPNVPM
jgi:hypothetical protein